MAKLFSRSDKSLVASLTFASMAALGLGLWGATAEASTLVTPVFGVLPFPDFDPVAFRVFGFEVKWYGLFYLIGLFGLIVINRIVSARERRVDPVYNYTLTVQNFEDQAMTAFLGAIVCGRLGYCFFYKPAYYLANPIEILYVHQGGMSFHGGFLGAVFALLWQNRKDLKRFWLVADMGASVAPFGLMVGRLANFINGELWGRPTDVPWAMVFPTGGPEPRHPSQLYESTLEGLVLLIVLLVVRSRRIDRPGLISGLFVAGYGIARFIVEFYRQPDAHIGLDVAFLSRGQLLSLPMIIVGIFIVLYSARNRGMQAQQKQSWVWPEGENPDEAARQKQAK